MTAMPFCSVLLLSSILAASALSEQNVDAATFDAFVAKYESRLANIEETYISRITDLEKRLTAAEVEIGELKDGSDNSNEKKDEDPVAVVSSGNRKLKSKRLLLPATTNVPPPSRVAFSAYLSHSAQELGAQHPIPFDRVLLNEGNAFDTVLHAFICPVSGVYVFQSALLTTYHDSTETELVKDGTVIANMYASGATSATGSFGYDQGFNAAVLQCNSGERIWVRIHKHRGTTVYAEKYTTFSGYLLWENE